MFEIRQQIEVKLYFTALWVTGCLQRVFHTSWACSGGLLIITMIHLLLSQSWNSAVYILVTKAEFCCSMEISRALGALAATQAGSTSPFEGQKGDFAKSAVMKLNLPWPTLHVIGIHYHPSEQKPCEPSHLHKLHGKTLGHGWCSCCRKSHPSCYLQGFWDLSCKTRTPLFSLINNQSH